MIAWNRRGRPTLVLLALGVSALACGAPQPRAETPPDSYGEPPTIAEDGSMGDKGRFQLYILQGTWSSMQLGYDLEPAWTTLRDDYASTSASSISESDVEAYDWERQIFTLSIPASQALVDQFAETDEQREHPEAALDQRAFVVAVDGEPVYGGIFLHPMSSMGIYFPVIYVTSHEGQLAFTLRPIQSVLGDFAEYEPEWHGIKDPRIREAFADAGVLTP